MAICTTEPNPLIKKLPHHRMAAILDEEMAIPWMGSKPTDRAALISPNPSQPIRAQGVSDSKNDDPATMQPIGEPLA